MGGYATETPYALAMSDVSYPIWAVFRRKPCAEGIDEADALYALDVDHNCEVVGRLGLDIFGPLYKSPKKFLKMKVGFQPSKSKFSRKTRDTICPHVDLPARTHKT